MLMTPVSAVKPPAWSAESSADVLPYRDVSMATTASGVDVVTVNVTSTTGAVALVLLLLVLLPPAAVVLLELPLDGGGLGGGGLGGGGELLFPGGLGGFGGDGGGGDVLLLAGGGDICSSVRLWPAVVLVLLPLVLLLLVALLLLLLAMVAGMTSETLVTATDVLPTPSCDAITATKAADTLANVELLYPSSSRVDTT